LPSQQTKKKITSRNQKRKGYAVKELFGSGFSRFNDSSAFVSVLAVF
jgi:hypothetical protein